MKRIIIALFHIFLAFQLHGQFDGLQFSTEDVMDGYTLFESSNTSHLVDNCGQEVNRWNNISAQYHAKLLPNGNLIYIEWFSSNVVEKDWDDNIVNRLVLDDNNIFLDYEVILLPNQNYLCLARRYWTEQQFLDMGYDYRSVSQGGIGRPQTVDVVVELDRNTGEIIWEWNIADHVIQERSPTAGNYGSIASNPQLLNMDAISTYDWANSESWMINGFDYNTELDQIVLSLRKMGEIAIIDHSTTTEEATGSTGGNSGKGGDILYRWGNPQNYGRGDADDRQLYFQHNPNWIKHGEHKGSIIMYNNGLNRPGSFNNRYSTVPIIDTPLDENGNYEIGSDSVYTPLTPTFEYGKLTTGNDFYSSYTSAAKVLPNGHVLITVGGEHQVLELKPDGERVWQYGLWNSPLTFRAEKYAADYPAFIGRDMTPGAVVESPPSSVVCSTTSTLNLEENSGILFYPNPAQTEIFIQSKFSHGIISDVLGREVLSFTEITLNVEQLNPGMYIITLMENNKSATSLLTVAR